MVLVEPLMMVPEWITIKELPQEFWSHDVVSSVVSSIVSGLGNPLSRKLGVKEVDGGAPSMDVALKQIKSSTTH